MDETAVVAAYGAAWLEPDAGERLALLETAWADDGRYEDPTGAAEGRAALSAHIGAFHAARPGARIEITSGVDRHHDVLRFAWRMVAADGSVAVEGIDFGVLAADGRLARIVGFFGPVPAA